jgi:hypothetical protein
VKRIWFILGAAWFVLSLGWFGWAGYVLAQDAAAIACGYPDAAAKAYASCMAAMLPRAYSGMWHQILTHDVFWIVPPALVLVAVGILLGRRATSPTA